MMNTKDILCVLDENRNRVVCNVNEPENKLAGVWILYGYQLDVKEWKSLQVGINKNIGKEVLYDVEGIERSFNPQEVQPVWYINQFGERVFQYKRSISNIDILYDEIQKKYSRLAFFKICDEIDDGKRKEIEKYIAAKTLAIYWRNGGSYSENNSREICLDNRKPLHPVEVETNEKLDGKLKEISNYLDFELAIPE